MQGRKRATVAVMAAGLMLWGAAALWAQAGAEAETATAEAVVTVVPSAAPVAVTTDSKIGVVDIIDVMNRSERIKDAASDLQAEQEKLKGDASAKAERLKELYLQRDGFKKGSEEWTKLDDESLQMEMEIRAWVAVEQAKVERKHMKIMLDMFRQIQSVVGRVAKEKGLEQVYTRSFLNPPQIEVAESTSLEDMKTRIVGQRVLYPADVTDVTEDVLKILNDEYDAAKAEAGGGEKPVSPVKVTPKG